MQTYKVIVGKDKTIRWYNDKGQLHRLDGPAIEEADGAKWWCVEGKQLAEEEFNDYIKPKPPKPTCEGKIVEVDAEREKSERYRLASLKFEAKLAVAIARAEHALDLWREFIRLLDIREESDSGREFSPNRLVSCRVMDGERINKIITTAKSLSQSQPKVVELERDKVRLDWLLARNVTISYQGANGSGVWVATYRDRAAIDTAMKEVTK